MVRRPENEYWLENEAKKAIVTLANDAKMRLLTFKAEEPDENTMNIVFYPGFLSYIFIWLESVVILKKKHNIYFWETREKEFSAFPADDMRFTIKSLAEDFKLGFEYLDLDPKTCVFVGSSIGSVGVIEAMSLYDIQPYLSVLSTPQVYYPADKLTHGIGSWAPVWLATAVKPIMFLWYRWKFRTDKRSARSRIHTMGRFLQKIQLEWMGKVDFLPEYHMQKEDVNNIQSPLFIVFGKDDPEHSTEKITQIKDLIPSAQFKSVPQKKDTHNEIFARIIVEELEKMRRITS